jgi:hypothetical protein
MALYKNIHMSLCNRPICYVTFVNKYYTLHTVHPQKSEIHNVQLKQVKITILYLNSQYFYTNETQPLPRGIDEFR